MIKNAIEISRDSLITLKVNDKMSHDREEYFSIVCDMNQFILLFI